jgi:hypothetical protein
MITKVTSSLAYGGKFDAISKTWYAYASNNEKESNF